MAYTRVNWENLPSTNTPVNADNLNKMDAGIANLETEVENRTSYSTNEVEIGKWVNGKTLYRRVFSGTVSNIESLCNTQNQRTSIINMYGHATATNGVVMPMNNSFSNSAYVWSAWWGSDMAVAANFGSNFSSSSSVIIVLEYTKD
jgi:hypothetical protein